MRRSIDAIIEIISIATQQTYKAQRALLKRTLRKSDFSFTILNRDLVVDCDSSKPIKLPAELDAITTPLNMINLV